MMKNLKIKTLKKNLNFKVKYLRYLNLLLKTDRKISCMEDFLKFLGIQKKFNKNVIQFCKTHFYYDFNKRIFLSFSYLEN